VSWGDILYEEEMRRVAAMSPEQIEEENRKKQKEEEKTKEEIKKYEVDKRKKLYTSADGIAKRKFNWPCKKQQYEGGCWLHSEKHGACSFIHKEEEEFYTEIFSRFKIQGYYSTEPSLRRTGDVKEGRCLFVTGVDTHGNLTFSKSNPDGPLREAPVRNTSSPQEFRIFGKGSGLCAW
jgi:hypothetical protein